MIIGLLLELTKLFISSAIFNSFLAIFLVIKPRIQGTVFGLCLAVAYVITLFEPLITTSNPAWITISFIGLFSFFGGFISQSLKYNEDDLSN